MALKQGLTESNRGYGNGVQDATLRGMDKRIADLKQDNDGTHALIRNDLKEFRIEVQTWREGFQKETRSSIMALAAKVYWLMGGAAVIAVLGRIAVEKMF